jgi:hypothetical protein
VADVYHALGIPADLDLRDRLGRPIALLPEGTAIRDILA